MNKIEALLRVILNDQAYLYALIQEMKTQGLGQDATPEEFEAWQNDWAALTQAIFDEILQEDNETQSNSS